MKTEAILVSMDLWGAIEPEEGSGSAKGSMPRRGHGWATAMLAGVTHIRNKRGGSAGQQSMNTKDSQVVAGTDGKVKAVVECYHCHKWGHFADKCPGKEMGHSCSAAIAPKGFDSATSFFSF